MVRSLEYEQRLDASVAQKTSINRQRCRNGYLIPQRVGQRKAARGRRYILVSVVPVIVEYLFAYKKYTYLNSISSIFDILDSLSHLSELFSPGARYHVHLLDRHRHIIVSMVSITYKIYASKTEVIHLSHRL